MNLRADGFRPRASRWCVIGVAVVLLFVSCASDSGRVRRGHGSGATGRSSPTGPVGTNTVPSHLPGLIAFARLDPAEVAEGMPASGRLALLHPGGRVVVLDGRLAFRTAPAWSPASDRLAFVGEDGLWVTPIEGPPRRVVACDPSSCDGFGPPAWSPDGGTLAFVASIAGRDGLWVAPATGGSPSPLTDAIELRGAPTYAPDGEKLAAIEASGKAVVIVNASSGEVVRRIERPQTRFGETVAWSPDGEHLLVDGTVDGVEGIHVLSVDGSQVRLLTACPEPGCVDLSPAWRPDSEIVIFTRGRCDEPGSDCAEGDLFAIASGGGEPRPLTRGPALDCCPAGQPAG